MRLGIMQGRLSPPGARPQSFPFDTWQAEFRRARAFGFDLIEWLFTSAEYERNPILSDAGLEEIRERAGESGVAVETICADYFVEYPVLGFHEGEGRRHLQVLNEVIERADRLGARIIVLPVLDAGEPRNAKDDSKLIESLREPLAIAGDLGVTLALETNIPADRHLRIMQEADSPALGICFDTGNRAAHGREIVSDVHRLAPYIREIHIKDRRLDGPNVPLGEGDAPLDAFFEGLPEELYGVPFVLETTVGDDYESNAKRNLAFTRLRASSASRAADPLT